MIGALFFLKHPQWGVLLSGANLMTTAAIATPMQDTLTDRRGIIAGILCYMLAPLGMTLVPLLTGAAATTFGLSAAQVGVLGTADLAGLAIASATAVLWINKISWRRAAATGIALLLVGNLFSAFVSSFSALCLARFVTELGSGVIFSLALVTIGRTPKPDRYFAFGIGATIALAVGVFLALPAAIEQFGMDIIFSVHAAVAILACSFIAWLPEGGAARAKSDEGQSKPLKPLFLCFVGFSCFTMVEGGVWTYMERIGAAGDLSAGFIGEALAITQVVSLVAALGASAISTRFGRTLPLLVGLFSFLLGFYLLLKPGSYFYLVAVCLTQFAWIFTLPYLLLMCVEYDPTGRFYVLTTAFKMGGMAAGPAVVALFLKGSDYAPVSWVGGVFLLICMAIVVPLALKLDRQKAA